MSYQARAVGMIDVEVQFLLKKHIFLDPEREIKDEMERHLLCFQV